VDSLIKNNKENKKRPEQKKMKQITKEEKPKVVPTPSKKTVWKQKEEAPKSTTTLPKSNKMVWRPKKVQSSTSTFTGTDAPSSSKE